MEDQRAGTGAGSNWKETMEMDWPYAQKARQYYHKEGTGLEPARQEIKRQTKTLLEKSQRERCEKNWKGMDRDQEAGPRHGEKSV